MYSEIRLPENDELGDRVLPCLYELSESRYCEICGERLEEYENECCVGCAYENGHYEG